MWNGFASCKLKAGGLLTCLLACLLPRVVGLKAVTRGDYSTIRGASEATNNTTAPQPYKKQTLPKPAAAAKGNRFFLRLFFSEWDKGLGSSLSRHAASCPGKLWETISLFPSFFPFRPLPPWPRDLPRSLQMTYRWCSSIGSGSLASSGILSLSITFSHERSGLHGFLHKEPPPYWTALNTHLKRKRMARKW